MLVLDPKAAGSILRWRLCVGDRGLLESTTAVVGILRSQLETAEYRYSALSRAAFYYLASPDERRNKVQALATHHSQLKLGGELPDNFESGVVLVSAEIARIDG